jgi:hypothetical protein
LIDEAHNQTAQPVVQIAAPPSAPARAITDELRELAELRNCGVIDDAELQQLKQRLISGGSEPERESVPPCGRPATLSTVR